MVSSGVQATDCSRLTPCTVLRHPGSLPWCYFCEQSFVGLCSRVVACRSEFQFVVFESGQGAARVLGGRSGAGLAVEVGSLGIAKAQLPGTWKVSLR